MTHVSPFFIPTWPYIFLGSASLCAHVLPAALDHYMYGRFDHDHMIIITIHTTHHHTAHIDIWMHGWTMGPCVLVQRHRNDLQAASAEDDIDGRHARSSVSRKNVTGNYDGEGTSKDAGQLLLQARVEEEDIQNAELMKKVKSGKTDQLVKYGDIIQLQHVQTGAFLLASEAPAPVDAECGGLALDEVGGSAALFKVLPRFKAQKKNSVIYFTHTLILESVIQKRMRLHTSSGCYSKLPDPRNPRLPKCLQTEKIMESNLSPRSHGFTITKYARFTERDQGFLRTADPFRLFQSQSESFVQCSSDPEKDRLYPDGRSGGNEPNHIPYFRELPDSSTSTTLRDEADPANHCPKQLWAFEPLTRSTCVCVRWDSPFRIRHVPSGRYLAIDLSREISAEISSATTGKWFTACLVDDEKYYEDDAAADEIGFKEADATSMIFQASATDVNMGEFVPALDIVNIRICHVTETGSAKEVYFMHNTHIAKKVSEEKGANLALPARPWASAGPSPCLGLHTRS